MRKSAKGIVPPAIAGMARKLKGLCGACLSSGGAGKREKGQSGGGPGKQDLDLYWDENFANALETWGEGNVWHEILYLMGNCEGRVLDIACGTGKTIELVRGAHPMLDLYGCDISDHLIRRAISRGIPVEKLKVCDATKTGYPDLYFDHAYSIGSLEHFTDDGITSFVKECARITRGRSFHMVPTSRSGADEGWIKTTQSYFNNSAGWWMERFSASFGEVSVLDSKWEDGISLGRWFLCGGGGAM